MDSDTATIPTAPAAAAASTDHADADTMSTLQSLAATIVIAVFLITFAVQAFQIPSESMEKTLLIGDYLLVDKAHYAVPGPFSWLASLSTC